jgi:hypothetical protein
MGLRRRRVTTGGLLLADQTASTVSNGLFAVAVASVTDVDTYGSFALSYSVMGALLVLWRNGILVRISARTGSTDDVRRARTLVLSLLIVGSPLLIATPLVLLWLATLSISPMSVLLALMGPVILAHDTLRYARIAAGEAPRVLTADILWLSVTAALWVLALLGHAGYALLTVGWCLGAVASWAALVMRHRDDSRPVRPTVAAGWAGVAAASPHDVRMVAVGALGPVTAMIYSTIVGGVAGPSVLATISAIALISFPITILVSATPFLLSHGGRPGAPTGGQVWAVVALTMGVAAAWLVILLLIPDTLGQALLGATWTLVDPLLPLGVAATATQAAAAILLVTLQLEGRSSASLWITGALSVVRVAYAWVLSIAPATASALLAAGVVANIGTLGAAEGARRRGHRTGFNAA